MPKEKKVIGYGAALEFDPSDNQYHRASKHFKRPGDVRNWVKRTFDEFYGTISVAVYFDDGSWEILK